MAKNILIVEDDKDLQKYLKELLIENNYIVQTATDGVIALNMVEKLPPDLVMLDLFLPNMGGESVCIEIKKKHPEVPVIMLTAKDSVSDIVQGLNLGADDYITKPFVADELLARIKARLRLGNGNETLLKIEDLTLNTKTLEVKRGNKKIDLTPTEFKLLEYFLNNKGRVLQREMILNRIWSFSPDIETRVVDVYVGYLRKKIDSGFKKKLVHSIRGFGYILK